MANKYKLAEQENILESGNELAAIAAAQINYHVMGYYPITPSTQIAEYLDEMKANGRHEVCMIPGDGEHGAAGICFGATTAGGRVFNATSANGLLFAMEQLPVQSGTRFPMVLNVVNRTVSGPLDIKCDQSDIMMALNTGWIIIMAHTTQMVYDFNILALKIAERAKLPIIVSSDGFFTSHQKKKVQLFKNDNSYNAGLFIVNSLYTAEGVMDKHSLWQRYVPLVRHEALRLQVRLPASVELDDLLQAGGIGLLNAVERYDALQGTAFTTYAVQRIRGAMLDELRSRDWVPRSVRRNAREVAQAIGQLEQELGRNATETEVAERLGIDIADYRQMLLDTNNSQLFSYDEWREEHGDSIELVTDDHQRENPLQQLLDNNLRQRVMEAIETLPEREKLVLTLYYQEELNLKEIGAVLEVGESRVSQLHSQAIKRLRTKLGKL